MLPRCNYLTNRRLLHPGGGIPDKLAGCNYLTNRRLLHLIVHPFHYIIGVTTLQIEGFCTRPIQEYTDYTGVTTLQIEGFCTMFNYASHFFSGVTTLQIEGFCTPQRKQCLKQQV